MSLGQLPRSGITHVMEPLLPGCYGVLTVAGCGPKTRLFAFPLANGPTGQPGHWKTSKAFPRKSVELEVVQQTGECLTVDVPKGPFRSMALSVTPVFDPSSVAFVNRPRVDWCYPMTAAPKQALRLVGRGLVSAGIYRTKDPAHPVSYGGIRKGKTTVMARRVGGQTFVMFPVQQSNYYEAWLEIPPGLKPGRYEVFVHNGLGGEFGWSEPMPLAVERTSRRSLKVFRVDDFLPVGQPTGHTNFDIYGNYQQKGEHLADEAIRQALEAAAAHGGGVVEFSGCVYDIGSTIMVPPGVTLRGQGADRTWLRAPFGEGPRGPYVVITGDGDFAVEDIRIVTYYAPVVIAVPAWTPESFDEAAGQKWHVFEPRMGRNVAIRRCFIHQRISEGWVRRLMKNCSEDEKKLIDRINRHFGLAPDCKDSGMMFAALRLRGEHVEVIDTTVLGAMNAVLLHGCRSTRLAGNTLRSGTGGVCLMMCGYRPWPAKPDSPPIKGSYLREILVEGNRLVSRSDRSRNGSFFYQSGMHCHMARNRIEDASRDSDGEGAGCHLWMDRWLGPRLEMTGPAAGRIVDPQGVLRGQDLVEAAIEITGGRGSGQIRMITRRDGDNIELDQPWIVAPDATSKVCFVAPAPFHKINFVDNHIENTGPGIILWGSSNDLMVDGNRLVYCPGIGVYSVNLSNKLERIWGGAYFTQVINNSLDVGMFQPDAETILDHKHESLPQHGVIANMSYLPSEDYDFLGLVVRGNCTKNNTGIIIKKTFRQDDGTLAEASNAGLVVEGNYARDSVAGVVIEDEAAAVDRANRAERVRWPLIRFDRRSGTVRFLE